MASIHTIDSPPFIYVAGPYTKPEPVENVHRAIRIGDALWDHGVIPIVPHLSMLWQMVRPRSYDEWLEYDFHLLARCDAVLRVRGESVGADREVQQAKATGQPVIYSPTCKAADCVSAVEHWLQQRGTA